MTLYLTRGDTRLLDITASGPEGLPYNLTGVALAFTVKRGHEDLDADALISKTTEDDIEITDAPGGVATITLAAADTAVLRPGAPYVFDLQAVDNDEVVTLASGSIHVLADVTRAVS